MSTAQHNPCVHAELDATDSNALKYEAAIQQRLRAAPSAGAGSQQAGSFLPLTSPPAPDQLATFPAASLLPPATHSGVALSFGAQFMCSKPALLLGLSVHVALIKHTQQRALALKESLPHSRASSDTSAAAHVGLPQPPEHLQPGSTAVPSTAPSEDAARRSSSSSSSSSDSEPEDRPPRKDQPAMDVQTAMQILSQHRKSTASCSEQHYCMPSLATACAAL